MIVNDSNMYILSLKSLISNMKLQVDSIETQNNNFRNNTMNSITISRPIGEQILNLSIQMLNSGIQAFNMGIKKSFNKDNFYEDLEKISAQINKMISDYRIEKQMIVSNQMMNEMPNTIIMPPPMMNQMQNEMMQPQMANPMINEIQNPMMQPQMMNQNPMMQPQMINPNPMMDMMMNDKKNFSFKNACKGNRDVSARKWRTVEQLLNKYMNVVYGTTNIRLTFLYDGKKIDRTEFRTLEDFFSNHDIPIITVMEM